VYEVIRSRSSLLLALGFVIVAVLGYEVGIGANGVTGHVRTSAPPVAQLHPAFAANVLLESSAGWKEAGGAPAIPGLSIAHAVVFAPRTSAASAGLLTGQLAAGEPTPLPAAFVQRLRGVPQTDVVSLAQTEAFRYSHLSVPGFSLPLTLYVIPSPGASPTVLACYATAALAADLRTCERIVATLRPVGQTSGIDLTPDAGYAARVSAAVGALDLQRVTIRREMHAGATLATVQRLASRLAEGFARAAASLAQLEAAPAAGQAQAVLSRSIMRGHDAYAALAAAAGSRSLSAYDTARSQVYEAESAVSAALEDFALLGYGHA
jgi:hypothetical protein